MLGELEPAFAVTVHTAQGSEYRAVILAALDGAPMLMTRGVLYTAITRAKELFIVVGDDQAVERMVANNRQTRRYSGLRAQIRFLERKLGKELGAKLRFASGQRQKSAPSNENKNRDGVAIPIFFKKPVTFLNVVRLTSGTNQQGTGREGMEYEPGFCSGLPGLL